MSETKTETGYAAALILTSIWISVEPPTSLASGYWALIARSSLRVVGHSHWGEAEPNLRGERACFVKMGENMSSVPTLYGFRLNRRNFAGAASDSPDN
jgi:hypothetical protein